MALARLPRARETIVYGGLTAGFLDACDACLFFGSRGVPPLKIARHVASGLLGASAFTGGAATVALGTALHFTVALAIATTFYVIARRVTALVDHPVIGGLGFGVVAYFVMGHVVLPLSRVPAVAPFSWPSFANGVIGHAVLIGLPIALWAARSTRRA